MAELNNETLMALMQIMDVSEVHMLTAKSIPTLNRMKRGATGLATFASQLDMKFLEKHGLKVCGCCGVKLVPTKPVRGQKLTCLCEDCWSSDFADDNYQVHQANREEINYFGD